LIGTISALGMTALRWMDDALALLTTRTGVGSGG
jgi:hypothetical protein